MSTNTNTLNTSLYVDPLDVENWKKFFQEVNTQCNDSLKEKIILFINRNLNEFPKARNLFRERINALIHFNEEIMIVFLKDVVEFKDVASCINPIINELVERGIIKVPKEEPPTFLNTAIDVGIDLIEMKNLPIVFKSNLKADTPSTPEQIYKKIQARYQDSSSIIEMNEILIDINLLLKTTQGGKNNKKKKVGGDVSSDLGM